MVTFMAILLVPLTSYSLWLLSLTCFALGLSFAVLHGMLKQMASIVYPDCDRVSAAVTAGMQASALLVLMVSWITGFGRCGSKDGLWYFYYGIAGLLVMCWACFHAVFYTSRGVVQSMRRRDYSLLLVPSTSPDDNTLDEPLLSSPADETATNDNAESEAPSSSHRSSHELSLYQLVIKSWSPCVAVLLTVASSMAVASWFNRVPSQDPTNEAFPQVLFYCRLIGDLLGRPFTLVGAPRSRWTLLVLSIFRVLAFVPIFFLYTNTTWIPRDDVAAIVGVFLFSFSSGYLATLCYQLAPTLLLPQERDCNTVPQASLINVCFSIAVPLGLTASFVLKSLVES